MAEKNRRANLLQELDDVQNNNQAGIAMPEQPIETPVQNPRTTESEGTWDKFTHKMIEYTGVKGQGSAIWVPDEVKQRLDDLRKKSKRNIPLRSLAAAMMMTFIEEYEEQLKEL
jgi:hypothetical protein